MSDYGDPGLVQAKQAIVETDVVGHVRNVEASGGSLLDIAEQTMKIADQMEGNLAQIESCILNSTDPSVGDRIVSDLHAGRYNVSRDSPDSVVGSCTRAWLAQSWNMMAQREAAIIMGCHAR